jgi:prefoldin subunit 5
MSAVGFAPMTSEDPELERLREACQRLNFAIRAIKDAHDSLNKLNIGQTKERLNNAQWQAREAKRVLAEVGKTKKIRK